MGNHVFPFGTWENAATNIQDAVDASISGDVVLVTNGTYKISSQIVVNTNITLKSVNGAEVTTVNAQSKCRCFRLIGPCIVQGFTITGGRVDESYGAGLYCSNISTVQYCRISGNYASAVMGVVGGGVYGGIIINSLITHNSLAASSYRNNPGAALGAGACNSTLYGCTIYTNDAWAESEGTEEGETCGGIYDCIAYNCIIVGNIGWNIGGDSWYSLYNCFYSGNPLFVNAGNGNYRLTSGSPCINAGTNLPYVYSTTDLDGNPRLSGDFVDIGAYEFGTLECSFIADRSGGVAPLTVQFAASVYGANTSNVYYRWDFNNNNSVDLEGENKSHVFNVYNTTGSFSVLLSVSNAFGEVDECLKKNYIIANETTATNISSQWSFNIPGSIVPNIGSGILSWPAGIITNWPVNGTIEFDGFSATDLGKYITFMVSTLEKEGVGFELIAKRDATGPKTLLVDYTTDGSAFNYYDSASLPESNIWYTNRFDFSGITGLDKNINAGFRIIGTNAIGSKLFFDSVSITYTTVPEPVSVILPGFALVAYIIRKYKFIN